MARPREFDPQDATEKAMQVFWDLGYEGASMPDLLDGMGLTRGSLYKAFKDKKSLYLRVLKTYEGALVDAGVVALTCPGEPEGDQRIIDMFRSVLLRVEQGDTRGCLLCTAAAGSEMSDPEIAQAVNASLAKLRVGLGEALLSSSRHANLTDDQRDVLADTLMTNYMGLRVLARSGLRFGSLDRAAEQAELILAAAA